MNGRVQLVNKNPVMLINWAKLVEEPLNEGRILEAFASADAIIDTFIEACLRELYHDFKSQDLINEIHLLRSRVNFDGLVLLEILKSKTIVDEEFVQKVRQFKLARNLCLHNKEGEYALIIGNPTFQYSTEEELDGLVKQESIKWIKLAYEIFEMLLEKNRQVMENKDYYFSDDFYNKNPKGSIAKQKFPKTSKR